MDNEIYEALKRAIKWCREGEEKAGRYDMPIYKDCEAVKGWIDEVAKEYELEEQMSHREDDNDSNYKG